MLPRIVVFNSSVTPYTNRLYESLADHGVDLAVLSCCDQEPTRHWAQSFDHHYKQEFVKGWMIHLADNRFAHLSRDVWPALNRLDPDLLIINGFYPSMVMGAVWAKLRRRRLGVTVDGWADNMPHSLYHRVFRPAILRQAKGVIVCGSKGKEFFVGSGVDPARIHTIPLVPAWERPESVTPFAERPFHLLWAAQMNDPIKNIPFFVELVSRLTKRIPGLSVKLVGTGPSKDRVLAELAALGVNFSHELVPWDRMPECYQSSRVLLLPSLSEPWGLVCNEAMLCGTPCIVSPHVGAGGDLVHSGRNGMVLPLDLDAWAEHAAALATDEACWATYSVCARSDSAERTIGKSVAAFASAAKSMLD